MRVFFCLAVLLAGFGLSLSTAAAQSMNGFDPYGIPENETPVLSIPALKAAIAHQGYSKVTDVMMSPATGIVQASALNPAGLVTNLQVDPTTGAILSALTAH